MKRAITILLALLMVISLAACGGSNENVFDKMYGPMTRAYHVEGDWSSSDAIQKAVIDILGEPDDISVGSVYSYLLRFKYNEVELYGLTGYLNVYIGYYGKVTSMTWGYSIPRETGKDKVEKMVTNLVKKMDTKYGEHSEGGKYRYEWKDNSGVFYGMNIYSDSIGIDVELY